MLITSLTSSTLILFVSLIVSSLALSNSGCTVVSDASDSNWIRDVHVDSAPCPVQQPAGACVLGCHCFTVELVAATDVGNGQTEVTWQAINRCHYQGEVGAYFGIPNQAGVLVDDGAYVTMATGTRYRQQQRTVNFYGVDRQYVRIRWRTDYSPPNNFHSCALETFTYRLNVDVSYFNSYSHLVQLYTKDSYGSGDTAIETYAIEASPGNCVPQLAAAPTPSPTCAPSPATPVNINLPPADYSLCGCFGGAVGNDQYIQYCGTECGINDAAACPAAGNACPVVNTIEASQVRWGKSADSNNANKVSGLGFTGSNGTGVTLSEVFYLGRLTHFNWPVYYAANDAWLNIQLEVSIGNDFNAVQSFSYPLGVDETPNSGTCVYWPSPHMTYCPDKIDLSSSLGIAMAQSFEIGGVAVMLQVIAFRFNFSDPDVREFISDEGYETSAFVFGRLVKACPSSCNASNSVANAQPQIFNIDGVVYCGCECRCDACPANFYTDQDCSCIANQTITVTVAPPPPPYIECDNGCCGRGACDFTTGNCTCFDPDLYYGKDCCSQYPTMQPSHAPSSTPTMFPTKSPTKYPTKAPTKAPTKSPTKAPSKSPTAAPSVSPTNAPSKSPTAAPSNSPTKAPTSSPTKAPSRSPTKAPTKSPTKAPTRSPTKAPSRSPTKAPTKAPTKSPTKSPSPSPTKAPTRYPTTSPTPKPTKAPVPGTPYPTPPTPLPTPSPSLSPSISPTPHPTRSPTKAPTKSPTKAPSSSPTEAPSMSPTKAPSKSPTEAPTRSPTKAPTKSPSRAPTKSPTAAPSKSPTKAPTRSPTKAPSRSPTKAPTTSPTKFPTPSPSEQPTPSPTSSPTRSPTLAPTPQPLCRCSQATSYCGGRGKYDFATCSCECFDPPALVADECCARVPPTPNPPTPKPTWPQEVLSNTYRPTMTPSASPSPSPTRSDPFSPEERECVNRQNCVACLKNQTEDECGWCAAVAICMHVPSLNATESSLYCPSALFTTACKSTTVESCEASVSETGCPNDCSGRGTCVASGGERNCAGQAVVCQCDEGFEGDACNEKSTFELDDLSAGQQAAIVAGISAALIIIVVLLCLAVATGVSAGAAFYARGPLALRGVQNNPLFQQRTIAGENPLFNAEDGASYGGSRHGSRHGSRKGSYIRRVSH